MAVDDRVSQTGLITGYIFPSEADVSQTGLVAGYILPSEADVSQTGIVLGCFLPPEADVSQTGLIVGWKPFEASVRVEFTGGRMRYRRDFTGEQQRKQD